MDCAKKKMLDFMDGKSKKFIIPVYQRNYDWRKDNCRQLFTDLIAILQQKRASHYFGSIVSLCTNKAADDEYIIIDGQQRITTLMLMMIAMIHLVKETDDKSIDSEQIKQKYLLPSDLKGSKLKLKPIKDDELALDKIFTQSKTEYIVKSHITENYQYFLEAFQSVSKNWTMRDIMEAISRLEIVSIKLEPNEDDPQLIFESLNSTGLTLTEADKVRNYILMRMDASKQEFFYENYWNKIEKLTSYNVSAFIRDYITYKERRVPNINKVYFVFKEYVQKKPFGKDTDIEQKEAVLKDLLLFAGYYNKIIKSKHTNDKINIYLSYMNKLGYGVVYPFLLEVFRYNDITQKDNPVDISDDELLEILAVIESFLVRRFICELPTMGLNKFFMSLGKDIQLFPSYKEEYVNLLKTIMLNHTLNTLRFPNDAELREKMLGKNFYKMTNRFKLHCFERFETFENKEVVELHRLTFEHIMPQKLSDEWQKELGTNYAEIHKTYLDCIGNLTFTAYNSEMSNKSFKEKKTMHGGFMDCHLFLNKYIAEQDNWNQEKIAKRSNLLIDRAISVWPFANATEPKSQQAKRNSEKWALDDDIDFTGYNLNAFCFPSGQKFLVDSWVEYYEKAAERVYNLETDRFREYLNNKELVPGFIGNKEDAYTELTTPIRISDDVYLEGHGNANFLVSHVKQLYQKLSTSTDNMYVWVQPKVK
jgi:uncharacterized protein with ParB-like and HNH nuclease domain